MRFSAIVVAQFPAPFDVPFEGLEEAHAAVVVGEARHHVQRAVAGAMFRTQVRSSIEVNPLLWLVA